MYIFLLDVGWDRLHGSVDGFNATRSENGDHVSLSGDRATCQVTGKNKNLGKIFFNDEYLLQQTVHTNIFKRFLCSATVVREF